MGVVTRMATAIVFMCYLAVSGDHDFLPKVEEWCYWNLISSVSSRRECDHE